MRCGEAEAALIEVLDDPVALERHAEVVDHLRGCQRCARELATYREVVALLQADPVPEPPPHVWEELLASLRGRIDAEGRRGPRRWAGWRSVRWWVSWPRPLVAGLAAAAVAVLVVVTLPVLRPIGAGRPAPSVSTQGAAGVVGSGSERVAALQVSDRAREGSEPVVVAGEVIDDPTLLAALIQRLPWAGEFAERIEEAWVWRPESDPTDWVTSLGQEDRELLVDRLREFRWSPS